MDARPNVTYNQSMFSDNTLTPKEAVRLCALGTVAANPMRYSRLAGEVRQFCARIVGPTLELMGTSIELLRHEGLLEAEAAGEDPALRITDAGRTELRTLLLARLRPASDLSKLILALKFRFLPLLDAVGRTACLDMLLDATEAELAALEDLRAGPLGGDGALPSWLDHEIGQLERRLSWLEALQNGQAAQPQ